MAGRSVGPRVSWNTDTRVATRFPAGWERGTSFNFGSESPFLFYRDGAFQALRSRSVFSNLLRLDVTYLPGRKNISKKPFRFSTFLYPNEAACKYFPGDWRGLRGYSLFTTLLSSSYSLVFIFSPLASSVFEADGNLPQVNMFIRKMIMLCE